MSVRTVSNKALSTHAYFLNLFTVFLLCLPLASCAVFERSLPPTGPEIQWDRKNAKEILARLRHDQKRIIDLTAVFSLSLDPPPQGQPSHLHGLIFFAKGPNGPRVRIKGLGIFGRLLFDLMQKGDAIQIYIPSQETLYQGQAIKEEKTGNVWKDMLTTVFADLSRIPISEEPVLLFNNDTVILPLVNGELWLDRKNALPRQWHRKEQIVFYDRYEHKPDLPPIPTRFRVETTDGSQRAICRLSQVCVNCDIAHIFDLSGYKARFVRDLSELDALSSPGF